MRLHRRRRWDFSTAPTPKTKRRCRRGKGPTKKKFASGRDSAQLPSWSGDKSLAPRPLSLKSSWLTPPALPLPMSASTKMSRFVFYRNEFGIVSRNLVDEEATNLSRMRGDQRRGRRWRQQETWEKATSPSSWPMSQPMTPSRRSRRMKKRKRRNDDGARKRHGHEGVSSSPDFRWVFGIVF